MTMRVLIFLDGDWWIAQCLDVDIATQASDQLAVIEEIQHMTYADRWLHDEDPERPANLDRFDDLPRAPALFFKAWDTAAPVTASPLPHLDHPDPIAFEFRVSTSRP